MNTEELNMALFEKINTEMKSYYEELKQLTPDEIINNALPYTIKSDILSVLDTYDLSEDQARALLTCENTLETIYRHYESQEVYSMDILRDTIDSCANSILEQNQWRSTVPIYPHSAAHARKYGEQDDYHTSRNLNIECRDAIQKSIQINYADNQLSSEAVRQVVAQFGQERTSYVLANTIQHQSWDGRYSAENKKWANQFNFPEDKDAAGTERRLGFVLESHPGLTDVFVNILRRDYILQRQEKVKQLKPSIRAKIKIPAKKRNSPNYSANKPRQER